MSDQAERIVALRVGNGQICVMGDEKLDDVWRAAHCIGIAGPLAFAQETVGKLSQSMSLRTSNSYQRWNLPCWRLKSFPQVKSMAF